MSFLAPLYVLGALGISLPILFHLIRRQPRGQRRFSSLMFLKPTPPTLTRRSRLENWPLLLLRALALLLLAAAFARPFLRSPLIEPDELPGRRIVVLVDTSASMKRDGLWVQANQIANDLLKGLKPADQLAIVSFDSTPKIELSFDQSSSLDLAARNDAAKQAIKQLKPTWSAGDLGAALILAADLLANTESDAPTDDNLSDDTKPNSSTADKGQLVVISDMEVGGDNNLSNLQAYSWPKEIKTEIRAVRVDRPTNAFATILQPRDDEDAATGGDIESAETKASTRIRVTNSHDAKNGDFSLLWASSNGQPIEESRMTVHVGPGESRVVRMTEPPKSIGDTTEMRLVLMGDDHGFDNGRYLARPEPVAMQIIFIGQDAAEPRESLLYYLQRTPLNNRRRTVEVTRIDPDAIPATLDHRKTPLVVVGQVPSGAAVEPLSKYVSTGGKLLWVLDKATDLSAASKAISLISAAPDLSISEVVVKDYSMLSKINFADPLFKPLADARYNDFTKIRFWSHRKITNLNEAADQIATFDNGDPAILEQVIGDGRLWILASGWQPTDSQLALSTKFVPLLDGFFRAGDTFDNQTENVVIGDDPSFAPSPTAKIEHDGSSTIDYRTRADFLAVDQPGFYRFRDGDLIRAFAANVADSESHTEPMASDELERYGVAMGELDEAGPSIAQQRQQRDIELESRQKIWQWILLGVLAMLGLETWLSGYLDRKRTNAVAAKAT